MLEPIALSPLLQKLRDKLPIKKDAGPHDRQLTRDDLNFLMASLDDAHVTFFNLFGRLNRFFPNRNKIDRGHPLTKAALVCLGTIDRILVTLVPPLSKFYGTAVVVGRKSVDTHP